MCFVMSFQDSGLRTGPQTQADKLGDARSSCVDGRNNNKRTRMHQLNRNSRGGVNWCRSQIPSRKERLVLHKQGRSRFQPVSAKTHWSCYHTQVHYPVTWPWLLLTRASVAAAVPNRKISEGRIRLTGASTPNEPLRGNMRT